MNTRTLSELERDRFLAQAENLARLVENPGWADYESLLSGMRLAAMEEMARCGIDQFAYWQGVVGTLAEILERPHVIISTAAAVQREESEADPSRRADLRALLNVHLEGDL